MRRMIMRTASALLAFLLLFGLAACGSKVAGTAPAAAMRRPYQPMEVPAKECWLTADSRIRICLLAPDEGTEQEALAWLREFMAEYAPQAP